MQHNNPAKLLYAEFMDEFAGQQEPRPGSQLQISLWIIEQLRLSGSPLDLIIRAIKNDFIFAVKEGIFSFQPAAPEG